MRLYLFTFFLGVISDYTRTHAHTPVRTYARAHNGSLLLGVHPCVLTCVRVESPGCRTAIKGRTWRLVSTSSTQSTESSSGWYGATPPACIELERILVQCGPRHPDPSVMGSAAAPSVSSKVGLQAKLPQFMLMCAIPMTLYIKRRSTRQ